MTEQNNRNETETSNSEVTSRLNVTSGYKVLGETDTQDVAGVYGHHTATTGPNYGVQGFTESDDRDAAGVYAQSSGNGTAIIATALDRGEAIRASTTGDNAAEISTTSNGDAAVQATNTASSGDSHGIYAYTNAGSTSGDSPAGVYGLSGIEDVTYGVLGRTVSESDSAGGVRGVATDTSGSGYGVIGETKSSEYDSAGVLAMASGDAAGLEAIGGEDGIEAEAGQSGAAGVRAYNYSGGSAFTSRGVEGYTDSSGGAGVYGSAINTSGTNYGVYGRTSSSDGYGVYSDGDLYVEGDVRASGTKPFVQTVDTQDGSQDIVYTAVEAPSVRTEVSGVATLSNGSAEISLPDHFDMVTDSSEPLVVQTTPYGGETGLKVTERSTQQLTVEDLNGEGNYEFAYTVRGTRDGYADRAVVQDVPTAPDTSEDGADAGEAEPPSFPDPPDRRTEEDQG